MYNVDIFGVWRETSSKTQWETIHRVIFSTREPNAPEPKDSPQNPEGEFRIIPVETHEHIRHHDFYFPLKSFATTF